MDTAKPTTIQVRYDGPPLSLNDYKSLHWRNLKRLIDPIKTEFSLKLRKYKGVIRFDHLELHVQHNTRLDLDNITAMIKPFMDTVVKLQLVKDDSRRYWDCLTIRTNRELPSGQVLFSIEGYAEELILLKRKAS